MSLWILVADSFQAHLYKVPSVLALSNYSEANSLSADKSSLHPEFEPFESFIHVESAEMDSEIASDKFGNRKQKKENNMGAGDSFSEKTSPKDHEKIVFAKQVAEFLDAKKIANEFDQLVIAAPARFVGLLNNNLSDQTSRCILKEIDKDYTHDVAQPRVLAKHLSQFLQ